MATENLIGREREQAQLEKLLQSGEAEFLALYGRRRVGKSFLIREFFEPRALFFETIGQKDARLGQQLDNFAAAFTAKFGGDLPAPRNWSAAFRQLGKALESRDKKRKQVLFFDETPWLAGHKSGFVQALDHFWNSWAVKHREVILIVCGSAAVWMIKNIIHDKGGLHNRITSRIHLMPFNLEQTELYLQSRAIPLDRKQIVELYMCMGGIPHYLRHVERHLSAAQNIDKICFTKDGFLSDEFPKLFGSLFDDAQTYMHVVRVLARQRKGLTRDELLQKSGMKSGGGFSDMLKSLEASGFISIQTPFGKTRKDAVIRLMDEFSMFHVNFIEMAPKHIFRVDPGGYWLTQRPSRAFSSWAGFAFEDVCLKHIAPIKKALGISAVSSAEFPWYFRPSTREETGVQIDLLIERADHCYSICEMKFSEKVFVIDKRYAQDLRRKKQTLQQHGKTGYTIFLAMITTYGVRRNEHANELVDQFVEMSELFA